MPILLSLIWGPTCTGKTAAAVELALTTSAPVIALDRFQGCREIATCSGRPLPAELRGTRRFYLAERSLSAGILLASEANQLLKQKVAECAQFSDAIILEGGSISILNEMVRDSYWAADQFRWSFQRLSLGDPDAFFQRARRRVEQMFHPEPGIPSLLDELVQGWQDPALHNVLADIDGYRAAIAFANRKGYSIPDLLTLSATDRALLIDEIAQEYLQHAIWQERDMLPIPTTWQRELQLNAAVC